VSVALGSGKVVEMPGNPVKMSDYAEESYSSPPTLGADTDDVMQTLGGMSSAEIAALRQQGVIA
jgi:crotonobetainyl-CoA:carnitine CoA-transferase CaiB-like acyl-CoA transferase